MRIMLMLALACALPAGLSPGQRVSVDKEKYVVGESIRVASNTQAGDSAPRPWVGIYQMPGGNRLTWKWVAKGASRSMIPAPNFVGRFEMRLVTGQSTVLARTPFVTGVSPIANALVTDKPAYAAGETMRVTVKLPAGRYYGGPWVGLYRTGDVLAGGASRADHRLTWQRATGGRITNLTFTAPNWAGTYEFRVVDRNDSGYVLDRRRITVEIPPVPGALSLAKDKLVVGEPIRVTVNLPANRKFSGAWVGLFSLDASSNGGAPVDAWRYGHQRVAKPGQTLSFTAPGWPGRYEIRLYDRDGYSYILDRIGLEVLVPPTPGAIRLAKRTFVVGESIRIDCVLPPGRYYHYPWIGLFTVPSETTGGATVHRHRLQSAVIDAQKPGRTTFTAPGYTGKFELRLFDRDGAGYVIDTAELEVVLPPLPGALALDQEQYVAGQPMQLSVRLPAGRYYHYPRVRLFRAAETAPGGAERESQVPLRSLSIPKDRSTHTVAAPPREGRYEIRLFDRDGASIVLDTVSFTVIVPPAQGALTVVKRRLVTGEAFTVGVSLPKGRYYRYPWVGLFERPGRIAGGSVYGRRQIRKVTVSAKTPLISFEAPHLVGGYELRLFDRDNTNFALASVPIEVVAPPDPELLSVEKRSYKPGELVRVRARRPQGRYTHYDGVTLVRSSYVAPGGALVNEHEIRRFGLGKDGARLAFQAPKEPGPYELRLHDRDASYFILDIEQFRVEGDAPVVRLERQTPLPGSRDPGLPGVPVVGGGRPAGTGDPRPIAGGDLVNGGSTGDAGKTGTKPKPAPKPAPNPAPKPQLGRPVIRFVGLSPGGGILTLTEIEPGRGFMVEARFAKPPEPATVEARVTGTGRLDRVVTLRRTDDPSVYRSGVIRVAGAAATKKGGGQ